MSPVLDRTREEKWEEKGSDTLAMRRSFSRQPPSSANPCSAPLTIRDELTLDSFMCVCVCARVYMFQHPMHMLDSLGSSRSNADRFPSEIRWRQTVTVDIAVKLVVPS